MFYDNILQNIEDAKVNNNNEELKKLVYISMLCNDTKISRGWI